MVQLKVNGVEKTFDGDPNMPLLWYLRDVVELTGTKFGCGMAMCGPAQFIRTATITIIASRSEMGRGSRTSVPLVLADELDADWSKMKLQQATGDKKYGDQPCP